MKFEWALWQLADRMYVGAPPYSDQSLVGDDWFPASMHLTFGSMIQFLPRRGKLAVRVFPPVAKDVHQLGVRTGSRRSKCPPS